MQARNFNLQSYFERIGYEGPANADVATISAIMRRQLFSVPFENLDVQAGMLVSMVPEDIVEKVLGRGRGGYCYEVNGLFAMALEALGIPYQFVAARPMFYPQRRPRTHMAIVAALEGSQWLCDLGFGSYGIRSPIDLAFLDTVVDQDFDKFRMARGTNGEYVLGALVEGRWIDQFSFDLSPQEWIDFIPANHLNATHPEAIFVRKLLVILHNAQGRSILLGDTLKTVSSGGVEKIQLASADISRVLHDQFGLSVDVTIRSES